jgi:SAM-dependent methyltransferase
MTEAGPTPEGLDIHPLLGPSLPSKGWIPAPRYILRRGRVLELLQDQARGRLLDVGCGAGTMLYELAGMGFHAEGIETSPDALTLATHINGARVPIHDRPQQWGEVFDVISALEVIEHIEDDIAALTGWRGWLKPGGRLIISVPAHMSLWTASDVSVGHFRRYSREDLTAAIETAGFRVLRVESYGYPLSNITMRVRAGVVRWKGTRGKAADLTAQSGVEREVETRAWPLLSSWLGSRALMFFCWLQKRFRNTDLGEGYIVIAEKP